MEPIAIAGLMTAGIPFVTALFKRVTRRLVPVEKQAGVHALIPLFLGILSTGLYVYAETKNVWAALAAGLGSGGAASSVRDVDKNLLGIVSSIYKLAKRA